MFFKAKKRLTFFDKLALIINIVSALFLLICYCSPYANPIKFSYISILGLFYIFLLILNFILVIYWLFRYYPYALISGGCILIGIGYLTRFYNFSSSANVSAGPGSTLRVMTYNVNSFLSIDDKSAQKGILLKVDSIQPDILNVQELRSRTAGHGLIIDSFKRALHTPYYFSETFITSNTDSTECAVFTKLPIINAKVIDPPKAAPETQAIYVDLKMGNKILRVYCLHLQSTHFEPEEHKAMSDFIHFRKINFPEIKLIFTKLKVAYVKRSVQAAKIKEEINQCPYPYIITGDFNDTPNSYAVTQISKGLKNSFVEKGNGSGITYYRDFPGLQIDYILASQKFNILSHKVIHAYLSDHYPVVSEIELN